MFQEELESTISPIPTPSDVPMELQSPIITSTEVSDLHMAILDLQTEQQNTNGLLIFLIAFLCGVVFFQNFSRGWLK